MPPCCMQRFRYRCSFCRQEIKKTPSIAMSLFVLICEFLVSETYSRNALDLIFLHKYVYLSESNRFGYSLFFSFLGIGIIIPVSNHTLVSQGDGLFMQFVQSSRSIKFMKFAIRSFSLRVIPTFMAFK